MDTGYFMESVLDGPSKGVVLVYGKPAPNTFLMQSPVESVQEMVSLFRRPIGGIFSILDPIYVNRQHPNGKNTHKLKTQILPNDFLNDLLNKVKWEFNRDLETYYEASFESIQTTMEKLGLTEEYGNRLLKDKKKGIKKFKTEFYEKIINNIGDIPKYPLTRVEGIEEILDGVF